MFHALARLTECQRTNPLKNSQQKSWIDKLHFGMFSSEKSLICGKSNEIISLKNKALHFDEKLHIRQGLFVFKELVNSVLYTYGMLLSVSLPSVPRPWPLRLMTGWWWFYCALIAVSYRASLTAILAKPEPL